MEENQDLIIRRSEIRKRLLPLEWDKRLNQIHFARDMELKAYRKELETIEKELSGGQDGKVL